MKKAFANIILFVFILLSFGANSWSADNLGMFGISLDNNLHEILDNAMANDFRINIYGSNLDPKYASKLFQLSYQYEIANEGEIDPHFGSNHSLYKIITNKEEIKYAKGFTVYNFLNQEGDRIGSFIFDDNLYFINKNKFHNNIIPVKLYKENITIDIIFHNTDNNTYKPLFFATSFFKAVSIKYAINTLNKRFGPYINLHGDNISAKYWHKDGTSVANYFGLNDRFVFYDINEIKKFNARENKLFEEIKTMDKNDTDDSNDKNLQKLHESM